MCVPKRCVQRGNSGAKNEIQIYSYRNIPNKGAGAIAKVMSDSSGLQLRFLAFQRWFRIENQTIIKKVMAI